MQSPYRPDIRGFALIGLLAIGAAAQTDDTSAAFMQAMHLGMKQMDRAMAAVEMTGNADHDFAVMMIPHHQGAIEMAKAELLHGKDPVMRRRAQEILVEQQSEIDAMRLWMAKRATAVGEKER